LPDNINIKLLVWNINGGLENKLGDKSFLNILKNVRSCALVRMLDGYTI